MQSKTLTLFVHNVVNCLHVYVYEEKLYYFNQARKIFWFLPNFEFLAFRENISDRLQFLLCYK